MTRILVRLHEEQWQVVMGESVVMVAKTVELSVVSAARLHVMMLREKLMGEADHIELGEGVTDDHIRAGYEAVQRIDVYKRRPGRGQP